MSYKILVPNCLNILFIWILVIFGLFLTNVNICSLQAGDLNKREQDSNVLKRPDTHLENYSHEVKCSAAKSISG